jgi:hypothetical protein
MATEPELLGTVEYWRQPDGRIVMTVTTPEGASHSQDVPDYMVAMMGLSESV